jgi:hypothetical protein
VVPQHSIFAIPATSEIGGLIRREADAMTADMEMVAPAKMGSPTARRSAA